MSAIAIRQGAKCFEVASTFLLLFTPMRFSLFSFVGGFNVPYGQLSMTTEGSPYRSNTPGVQCTVDKANVMLPCSLWRLSNIFDNHSHSAQHRSGSTLQESSLHFDTPHPRMESPRVVILSNVVVVVNTPPPSITTQVFFCRVSASLPTTQARRTVLPAHGLP